MTKTTLFILLMMQCIFGQIETPGNGKVLLIRHGEKSAKSKTGDVHLNQRGEIRAVALGTLFFPNYSDSFTMMANMSLPDLHSIIAQSATNRYRSRRKIETAEPIAAAGNIPLDLFDHEDITGICNHVKNESSQGRSSLVVWDHTTISDIANDLLKLPRGTIRWPMDRYDVIWLIDLRAGTLVQYCQHLLFGDLWCPLNPIQVYPVTNEFLKSISSTRGFTPIMA